MKKPISIVHVAMIIVLMSIADSAQAQRFMRGGAAVIVAPAPVAGCRVKIHRGWHHRRAMVYARPMGVRAARIRRNHW